MTILDALADKRLFGSLPAFADLTSWGAWETFLRAVHGLPMTEPELEASDATRGAPLRIRPATLKPWRSSDARAASRG